MADFLSTNINSIQGSLFHYINEVNKLPMLSEKQELEYAQLKEKGNIEAVRVLVSSHLRLVVKIAFKYKNYKLPILDLIQEGNIGLMKAVKGFKLGKGCRFATYATWWIRAYIQDYILKTWSLIKIGTTSAQKKLFFNLRKIKNKILNYDRKYLTHSDIKMIAKEYDVSEKEVKEMNIRLCGENSLNVKVANSDDKVEVIDLISDTQISQEEIIENKRKKEKQKEVFQKALNTLNERELDIVKNRQLRDNPLKLKDLSAKYGISNERVRQIEKKAVEKLKIFIKENFN